MTTDAGGNREILEDAVHGWIADAATPYSMDKTLEQAWKNQEHWESMGIKAHQKSRELAAEKPEKKLLCILEDAYQKQIDK